MIVHAPPGRFRRPPASPTDSRMALRGLSALAAAAAAVFGLAVPPRSYAAATYAVPATIAGDCSDFGRAATRSSGTVHDSSCSGTGRNAVSVTAGDDILVQHVTTSAIGYIAFDVEPNVGPGWGSRRVTFDANTIGSYYLYAY